MGQHSKEPAAPPAIVVTAASRRLNVMVSSTSLDLPEHRQQVIDAILRVGHFPLAMEHGSAKTDADAISLSLGMVDQADVYLGLFAGRYGSKPVDAARNPQLLSVTELEYRRALSQDKPMLLYLAHAEHPFTEAQFETNPDSLAKREALKEEIKRRNICGFFRSAVDLRGLVIQSLSELRIEEGGSAREEPPAPKLSLPVAPAVYAVPEYRLTHHFVGRSSELDTLDGWAAASEAAIMVVEGIGGQGKSALTWEWMQRRAEAAIPNLAGRLWWSFYEQGTSMVTFVRHALAYVTGQDPEALRKDTSHHQRGNILLTELRKRPFLLVLDGFERVLTAYHRLDKAQIPDHLVDAALRDCINPADGDLLLQLLDCAPSRILISTRLMPGGLQDRASHRPIAGVAYHKLDGLSPADALALMRQAGVTGKEQAMLELASQFGRHSLLLRIVCGMIADYRRKPYDFDAWRADPIYGGGLKLAELELKQRYTHILHHALRGLSETTRKLLSRIAVISESASYDTLAVLNPFLPPKQEHLASADYRQAVKAFDEALSELENRGLLQWDRDANRYEMHPVVRGHAAELLEAPDRIETFDRVRSHFEALPPDDLDKATELAHVTRSLEIYRCLTGAGRPDDAAEFYRETLSYTLLLHVGAYPAILELLKPLFRNDLQGLPSLESPSDQSYVLNDLAFVLGQLGRREEALEVLGKALQLDLRREGWVEAVIRLRNLHVSLGQLGRRAEAGAALALARAVAEAAADEAGVSVAILSQMGEAVEQGRFSDAAVLLAEFRRRPRPPVAVYRPGDAELWCCVSQLFQGTLTEAAWQEGHGLALRHRNIYMQPGFLALRAEWDLGAGRPERALDAIEEVLRLTNRLGTPRPDCHDLRAWALAALGRTSDAAAALQMGEQGLFAAEACLLLGERGRAHVCALNAYRWAWGEGPPYIHWYYLERSRDLLRRLGEPEPRLPPFDPAKVPPIPFEGKIRAAIDKLRQQKESKGRG